MGFRLNDFFIQFSCHPLTFSTISTSDIHIQQSRYDGKEMSSLEKECWHQTIFPPDQTGPARCHLGGDGGGTGGLSGLRRPGVGISNISSHF